MNKRMPRDEYLKYMMLAKRRDAAITRLFRDVSGSNLRAVISQFQNYHSRNTYSKDNGLNQAVDWAAQKFAQYGFRVERDRWNSRVTPSVVATLTGTQHPEKLVVMG